MMGGVLCAPFLESHPEAAFGSVMPDLAALSRVFGKGAFLTAHQTCSRAFPAPAYPRTRNLKTRFGELELALEPGGRLQVVEWHV